jgi:pyruvate,orthophosphate dikinase
MAQRKKKSTTRRRRSGADLSTTPSRKKARAKKKTASRNKAARKKIVRKKTTKKGATGRARRKVSARPTKKAARRKVSKKKATRKASASPSAKRAGGKKKVGRKKAGGRKAQGRVSGDARAGAGIGSLGMIFRFGAVADGASDRKDLLGGKGANLAEMSRIGLPVPSGFTIATTACEAFQKANHELPDGLMDDVHEAIGWLEGVTGKSFGGDDDPLLVSVRSGAAASMPGMMDTVLNLGLTDRSVRALADLTGDERFAWDAYRRLIHMFGDVVMGVKSEQFEEAFRTIRERHGVSRDVDVPADGMKQVCDAYKDVYQRAVGHPFPQNPTDQLEHSIKAVFKSWNTARAVRYRQIHGITGLRGTGVNVQAMVFGNLGNESGTGVAFTRNPSTGEDEFYGEFLESAQGEDVVAGIRTPEPISAFKAWNPEVYEALEEVRSTLERHYRDMQDIEFTVERGTLYMLQTRNGKRSGPAAVKIACDMVAEGLISEDEAVARVPAGDVIQLLLPSFTDEAKEEATLLTKGLPASPGVATGRLAFTAEEVVERTKGGETVILVRMETSPEDIDGMHSAAGILTSTGGMTSHAAVVARGWGKCCVAGAGELDIDAAHGMVHCNGRTLGRDDVISIDGSTGEVMLGEVERTPPEVSSEFETLMEWADARRTLEIRTNADTPEDARRAREFGAEGIGLCRTEHMFFGDSRIRAVREMIIAETDKERDAALAKLLPLQRQDFIEIFEAMEGMPVTVRLLDPPLHEFLPSDEHTIASLADRVGKQRDHVRRRIEALQEMNPMLGHRGCRVAITFPAILRMQVRAIVEAAVACRARGVDARPEIMVPLVATSEELAYLRPVIESTIADTLAEQDAADFDLHIGTMIEIPRACLVADRIAANADFFSFGTNDLTQLTFGFSRDDLASFLPKYLDEELLPVDPFQSIDRDGVGRLVGTAVEEGRETKPHLKVGICGEHGGDPKSIAFCHGLGLDYVSCSPFRVPIARLAAAQAAIGALEG